MEFVDFSSLELGGFHVKLSLVFAFTFVVALLSILRCLGQGPGPLTHGRLLQVIWLSAWPKSSSFLLSGNCSSIITFTSTITLAHHAYVLTIKPCLFWSTALTALWLFTVIAPMESHLFWQPSQYYCS